MQNQLKNIEQDILSLAAHISQKVNREFTDYRKCHKKIRGSSGIQDITTKVDHAIGKFLIDKLLFKYSKELTIDSEEKAERAGNGPVIMRVDPLDGTKHFVRGLPEIASCISLNYKNEVIFGVVINPITNDVYHAKKGGGAFLNSKKITVGNNLIDDDFSFVFYEPPNSRQFVTHNKEFITFTEKLTLLQQHAYRMRNIGLASLSICYVAAGISPLYVDFSRTTKIYDIEAAILIAHEAGATIGTVFGKKFHRLTPEETDKKHVEECVMVGNPSAWQQTINLLQNQTS